MSVKDALQPDNQADIPDCEVPVGTGVEFLGVGLQGNIYSGEVGCERLVKYIRVRP